MGIIHRNNIVLFINAENKLISITGGQGYSWVLTSQTNFIDANSLGSNCQNRRILLPGKIKSCS